MKLFSIYFLALILVLGSQAASAQLSGKVTSLGTPLQGATIKVKGFKGAVVSKSDGSFKIMVPKGGVLLIEALGMFSKEVIVQEQEYLHIKMKPSYDQLDEVILTSKTEQIYVGDRIIKGTNEDFMPGGVTQYGDFYITNKDIIPNGKSLKRVLREKFKGIVVHYTPEGEVVTVFGRRPLWIVNGFAIVAGEPIPLYILDKDIASIVIKKSFAMNIKYGGQGERGLQIIVTTKQNTEAFKEENEVTKNGEKPKINILEPQVEALVTRRQVVSGLVSSSGLPVRDALVSVKGSLDVEFTQQDGSFLIAAKKDDMLLVKASGYQDIEELVTNKKVFNLELIPKTKDATPSIRPENNKQELKQDSVASTLVVSESIPVMKVKTRSFKEYDDRRSFKAASYNEDRAPKIEYGQTAIVARIVDSKTAEPVAFANVGIVNKSLGTVSDEEGYFKILSERIQEDDTFRVSMLGYESQSFTIKEFKKSKSKIIRLKAEPFELGEAIITELVKERTTLGYQKVTDDHLGYWKDKDGLGGEIATRVRIKKKRTKLLKVHTNVFVSNADSILTRLNVYNYKKRFPQENVANTTVYKTITSNDAKISIDLNPYNIIVDDDVVISVELVKVYGDSIQAGIYGSPQNAISFTRSVSQDDWKRHEGKGVAIALEVGQIKKQLYTLSKERETVEAIRIFWDASRSLKKNRNFEKEFDVLTKYLKSNPDARVHVTIFNNLIRDARRYQKAKEIDFKALGDFLRSVPYDGMADYRHLQALSLSASGNTLIFTDGTSLIGSLQQTYKYPVFTISSSPKASSEALQEIALFNDGYYINLATTSVKRGVEYLRYDLEDFGVYNAKKDKTSWIAGKVYLDSVPVQGALVNIKGTFVEEQTTVEGDFKIPAQVGDLLKVDFFGTVPKEISVKNDKPLEVYLETLGTRLKEVVLEITKEKKRTSVRNEVTHAVLEITAADIDPNETQLRNVLRENTSIRFDKDGKALFPRAYSAIGVSDAMRNQAPSIMIDGTIYEQSREPYVDPAQISTISIVDQRTGQNYYNAGSGLIIIRTKTFQESLNKRTKERDDVIKSIEGTHVPYEVSFSNNRVIQQLSQVTLLDEALRIYNENIHQTKNVPYYLEAGELFAKWDTDIAASVMSNALVLAPDNTRVLKIVASFFEEFNKPLQAENIYAHIAGLLPNNRLAMRDLSMIAEVNGNYMEAHEGYKKLATSLAGRKDVTTLAPIVKNEFNRLITVHQDVILQFDKNQYFKNPSKGLDLRLVLSWMPSNLDIELQFISPDNEKFKWKLLDRKVASGNLQEAIEEFVLPDAPKGEWLINMKYNGDDSFQLPPYLKLSIYKNFATALEDKEVRTLKLLNQSKYSTIGRIIL